MRPVTLKQMSLSLSFFSPAARRSYTSRLCFFTVALLSLCAVAAKAVTIPVTTTADVRDAAGTCLAVTIGSLPGPDGVTSLREAVCAANSTAASDTITFSVNGTFALTGNANDDSGMSGDLDVTQTLIVQGNGPANTIIDGTGNDRIFDVNPAAGRGFELHNLTVRNGNVQNAALKNGGAMVLSSLVTSTITGCVIADNFAAANGAIDNRGNLTIDNSVISGNQVVASNGSATGGGVHTTGAMQMNNCSIVNNFVRGDGGGVSWSVNAGATVTITNSTFSGNSASQPVGVGNGGGIAATFGNQGALVLTNCTISGNHAENFGGGAYVHTPGGGTGSATLTNVTIANNSARNDTNFSGAGGGLAVNNASVTLRNTIVADNRNQAQARQDDINGPVAPSSSGNLIGDSNGSSGLTNGMNNNQVGFGPNPINPMLGSRTTNGGPTETHALLSGSPAIDRATNANAPATDQRGTNRPVDGDNVAGAVADIGAFEVQLAPTVLGAVSRKNHSGDNFDVNLPLSGTPGIEPRLGGATNDYTIVVTFSGNPTFNGNPQAQVISGTGTVGSGGVSNGGVVTADGGVVTIPLTGVMSQQTIHVRLNGVNGTFQVVIPMGVLVGDATGDGSVNAGDAIFTRNRSGESTDATNFRSDYNADGVINAGDAQTVRTRSGQSIP